VLAVARQGTIRELLLQWWPGCYAALGCAC